LEPGLSWVQTKYPGAQHPAYGNFSCSYLHLICTWPSYARSCTYTVCAPRVRRRLAHVHVRYGCSPGVSTDGLGLSHGPFWSISRCRLPPWALFTPWGHVHPWQHTPGTPTGTVPGDRALREASHHENVMPNGRCMVNPRGSGHFQVPNTPPNRPGASRKALCEHR
jgi:hypothetical protein